MGIYTNFSGSFSSTNYADVQPFVGENFNYHELGIIAATEMAANHNAFMRGIALSELAAFEQTGSTDILYESVDIKGIFEKIKMFFKKIIEKIHKIFHTFIAKMSSWFSGNDSFVKKYEKEVIKGWANVKSDWEFKGYKFSLPTTTANGAGEIKVEIEGIGENIKNALANKSLVDFISDYNVDASSDESISKVREKMDDVKDAMRKSIIDGLKEGTLETVFTISASGGIDSSEFTEELFKVFRSDADSKEDLSKENLLAGYGGSISGMMTYIKEFDKIKSKTEAAEKKITSAIDKLISEIGKKQDELIKANKNDSVKDKTVNERIVQGASLIQTVYGALSEFLTQAFSALLQANKDACSQAKEVAVKVIGQSKKMTEESYDFSASSDFDFISSVKLV